MPQQVKFTPSYRDFAVCSTNRFSMKQVFQTGVVGAYDDVCGKLKWQGGAKPGEVVIFVRKLSFWQRVFEELP